MATYTIHDRATFPSLEARTELDNLHETWRKCDMYAAAVDYENDGLNASADEAWKKYAAARNRWASVRSLQVVVW